MSGGCSCSPNEAIHIERPLLMLNKGAFLDFLQKQKRAMLTSAYGKLDTREGFLSGDPRLVLCVVDRAHRIAN